MKGERYEAGLWCSDVLGMLSEYLDGELEAVVVKGIEAHLQGCDVCERFGADFSGAIAALRKNLSQPEPLDADVAQRLCDALAKQETTD